MALKKLKATPVIARYPAAHNKPNTGGHVSELAMHYWLLGSWRWFDTIAYARERHGFTSHGVGLPQPIEAHGEVKVVEVTHCHHDAEMEVRHNIASVASEPRYHPMSEP